MIIPLWGLIACTLHPLQKHPSSECRGLFLLLQDTTHWKLDTSLNVYVFSDQIMQRLKKNSTWDISQIPSCFEGLSAKEIRNSVGIPTSDFTNTKGRFVKYDLDSACNDPKRINDCEYLSFYFEPEGSLKRVGIVGITEERN